MLPAIPGLLEPKHYVWGLVHTHTHTHYRTNADVKARIGAEMGRRHAAKRFYCEGRAAARV